MAKSHKRSSREPKKPEQDKPKATAASRPPFPAATGGKPAAPPAADKK